MRMLKIIVRTCLFIVFITVGFSATAVDEKTFNVKSSPESVWISAEEIASLPTSGPAWDNLLDEAQNNTSAPNISNKNDNTDVYVYAKALAYLRTQKKRYRNEVIDCVMKAMGTENRGSTLALSRNLSGYVIAAGLVGLPGSKDKQFRIWLRGLLTKDLSGRSLRSTHDERPNNWGTFAGGQPNGRSRIFKG